MLVDGKRVLVTGGTGSLGQALVRRLLRRARRRPEQIIVFSRDEAKQHADAARLPAPRRGDRRGHLPQLRASCSRSGSATCATTPRVGSACCATPTSSFNAAALKQVPTCEYFPFEAVADQHRSAPQNIVRAIREHRLPVETVVGISTDKACKPVNVMGMTKAMQERIFIQAQHATARARASSACATATCSRRAAR